VDVEEGISELRAVAHPVRLRMLSMLTGTPMSAAEVARELGLTHANASYHLRVLAQASQLEEAGEEQIRGGRAKRYRYRVDRGEHDRPRGHDDHLVYTRALFAEVERRVLDRSRGPGMSFDLEGWVTPEVWRDAVGLLHEASALLHDNAQAARTPGTVHVSATSTAFTLTGGLTGRKARG
jgi:DNA-binding transcriptional ArsR family regulator